MSATLSADQNAGGKQLLVASTFSSHSPKAEELAPKTLLQAKTVVFDE